MRRWTAWLVGGMVAFSAARAEIQVDLTPAEGPEGFSVEVVAVETPKKDFRVYIYHTHTYEAYTMTEETEYAETETWRTADENHNMIRIGRELKGELEASGIFVTHNTTAFEPPKLSTAYARSLEALEREEGYDLYIDLHRDAYSTGNGPNTVMQGEKSVARVLFLIGQGASFDGPEKPDWERNFAAAKWISDEMNAEISGLSRGVALKSGRYNQHAKVPCILIEVGNNRNTLSEALATVPFIARGICSYFDDMELPSEQKNAILE